MSVTDRALSMSASIRPSASRSKARRSSVPATRRPAAAYRYPASTKIAWVEGVFATSASMRWSSSLVRSMRVWRAARSSFITPIVPVVTLRTQLVPVGPVTTLLRLGN